MATPSDEPQVGIAWVLDKFFKNILATFVFAVSTLGIIYIALWILEHKNDQADKVFSTVVPLFATWVGTILAFYFSKENFDAASRAVNETLAKLTPSEEFQRKSIVQVMRSRSAILGIDLYPEGED